MEILVGIAVCALLWWAINNHLEKKRIQARRAELMAKYHDRSIVDRIMARMVWQDQTEEQLRDSLGLPVEIDQRVMKNKVRETWKYHQQGKNRFGLRVTVENGLVVGWDQKN